MQKLKLRQQKSGLQEPTCRLKNRLKRVVYFRSTKELENDAEENKKKKKEQQKLSEYRKNGLKKFRNVNNTQAAFCK